MRHEKNGPATCGCQKCRIACELWRTDDVIRILGNFSTQIYIERCKVLTPAQPVWCFISFCARPRASYIRGLFKLFRIMTYKYVYEVFMELLHLNVWDIYICLPSELQIFLINTYRIEEIKETSPYYPTRPSVDIYL